MSCFRIEDTYEEPDGTGEQGGRPHPNAPAQKSQPNTLGSNTIPATGVSWPPRGGSVGGEAAFAAVGLPSKTSFLGAGFEEQLVCAPLFVPV